MTTTTAPSASWDVETLLQRLNISQSQLARDAGISRAALQRIAAGQWPKTSHRQALAGLLQALREAGAHTSELRALLHSHAAHHPRQAAQQKAPTAATDGAAPSKPPTPEKEDSNHEEEAMLMQNTPIAQAALKHFGLHRSPFVGDINERADVFETESLRYARAALRDCAQHHGFIALVGESGAGKTTLLEDFEQSVLDDGRPIIIVRPYVQGMEHSDSKGKTLKASQIADAFIRALDPQSGIRRGMQARFAQLHDLLKASAKAGNRHLLAIDEAHCMPTATLKHLKRFLELKEGMRRLLGVAIIGQPELRRVLKSSNAEVREVMQRCEIVELQPLDDSVQTYLQFKLARVGAPLQQVFEPDAFEALRARLVRDLGGRRGSQSMAYPLALHNLTARCMNLAAQECWPLVDSQCVMGV